MKANRHNDEQKALAKHLDCSISDISYDGDHRYSAEGYDWIVADDDTADYLAREDLRNYVDECVLNEIPEQYQCYFDVDAFIDDALVADGRGHTLARYDGEEREEEINGVTFYLYKN